MFGSESIASELRELEVFWLCLVLYSQDLSEK